MATHLRLVTLNLWGLAGDVGARLRLAARQLGTLGADVIALQEVRPLDGVSGRTTADELAGLLDMQCAYSTSVTWVDDELAAGMPAGQEGLAILSRLPIEDTRSLGLPDARPGDARQLWSARVATAAGPIWVHTTHLHYRLDDGLGREAQVLAIDEAIRAAGRDVGMPPQLLCGDFNATADSDEMRFLRGLTTLGGRRTHFQDAWLRLHREPGPGDGPAQGITWSAENPHTRALRSLDLDRRIDYVYVTTRQRSGAGTVRHVEVALTERDGETCASDHFGVLADVQVGRD